MVRWGILVLIALLTVALLVVSCTAPNSQNNLPLSGTISSLDQVSQNQPTYGLVLLSNEDFIDLVSTITQLFSLSKSQEEELADSFEEFLNLLDTYGELIENARKFLDAKDSLLALPNRHEYCIQITGVAKDQILSAFSSMTNQEFENLNVLCFDYRDVMLLSLPIEVLVGIYDFSDELRNLITLARRGFDPQDWFTDQAIEFSQFLVGNGEVNWQSLKEEAEKLAAASTPNDVLDLRDIFKEGKLTIRKLDRVLRGDDNISKTLVEIYDYEMVLTQNDGKRKDGKETLWTVLCSAVIGFSSRFSFFLDQPVMPTEMMMNMSIKINDLELTQTTKWIDLLREFEKILPNNKLIGEIVFEPYTGLKSQYSVEINFAQFYKSQIDFRSEANIAAHIDVFEYLADHGDELLAAYRNLFVLFTPENIENDIIVLNDFLDECEKDVYFLNESSLTSYSYTLQDYNSTVILYSGEQSLELSNSQAILIRVSNLTLVSFSDAFDWITETIEKMQRMYRLFIASRRLSNNFEKLFSK